VAYGVARCVEEVDRAVAEEVGGVAAAELEF
jgi:hypothetical protein